MISRRFLLQQAGTLSLGLGAAWLIREKLLWPAPRTRFGDGAASSGWLPFVTAEAVPIVRARVDGLDVNALLDSGAQSSAIDLATVHRLRLRPSPLAPVLAFGVEGGPKIGGGVSVDVELGALTLQELRAAALDLGPVASDPDSRIALILGQDVLRQVIADVDFPTRRVALRPPGSPPALTDAVQPPSRLRDRELLVRVAVNDKTLDAVLDTGSSSPLSLAFDVASAAGLLNGRSAALTPTLTFGGVSAHRMVTVDAVAFAGLRRGPTSVEVFTPDASGRSPRALLGVGLLQDARLVLDLRHGRLWIAGPAPAPRPLAEGQDSSM